MSEAYLAAATRLRNDPTLQVENYAAWFRRVLFLTCLDHGRRFRRNSARFVDMVQMESETLEMIAAAPQNDDLRISIEQALLHLPAVDQEIIEMAAEGHTSEEIGQRLEPPLDPQAVRKRKSRALRGVAEMLRGSRGQIR